MFSPVKINNEPVLHNTDTSHHKWLTKQNAAHLVWVNCGVVAEEWQNAQHHSLYIYYNKTRQYVSFRLDLS